MTIGPRLVEALESCCEKMTFRVLVTMFRASGVLCFLVLFF